jgi:hypothetical protein
MPRITPLVIGLGFFATGILHTHAQYVPTAPKPPQLAQANSVFIANNTSAPLANSDRIYDEIYAGIQAMHRFKVVLKPADADLILEFSLVTAGDDSQTVFLRVMDGKTHVVLWSVSDSGQTKAIYGTHGKKNEHDVVDNILDYLAIVTSPPRQTQGIN